MSKSIPPSRLGARKPSALGDFYEDSTKKLLRECIEKAGSNYEVLAEILELYEVSITPRGLENKIAKGTFSAAFFFVCMDALDVLSVERDDADYLFRCTKIGDNGAWRSD